ncbi:hypothetical protein [Nesterenkonia marinintestina]|uniref:hypothetical protein n=1 Tax=Nesterenkonia marinintestina TaxID=2979865 RepID=UPI0021BF9D7D|nr:hypothetical protein [Nesterenkonia sp. GX14115]
MTDSLRFAEAAALQDMNTYAARALRIQDQGIRLQAVGAVLAAWVPVMTPSSLVGRLPAVLGLRTAALAEPSLVDATVELRAVTERLARLDPAETELPVPPKRLSVPWAAVTPPRRGWEPMGEVDDDALRRCAEAGIAEIREAVPTSAGAAVVEQVREKVWGRPATDVPVEDLPAGAAFGAHALHFLAPEGGRGRSTLHRQGAWLRISGAGGFVVVRSTTPVTEATSRPGA